MIRSLYQVYNRYRTLKTDRISSLPIIILMPHSACNCKCVMCDIWKGNKNQKQLSAKEVESLLVTLRKFGTQQVLMSGGEALLNPNFFLLCEMLKKEGMQVSLLSTGITLAKNATEICRYVDEVIVSLDGDEAMHDAIRNVPGAFRKMKEGIDAVRAIDPAYKISGRSVIHKMNFEIWPRIIDTAKQLGLNSISFLPADVSSAAFNRELLWDAARQHELLLDEAELKTINLILETILHDYEADFRNRFIAESPQKLQKLVDYYAAFYGFNDFPYKKCNAPWVSAVIEADGTVRPCFFHKAYGNIKDESLEEILNSEPAVLFRKGLDINTNKICKKCVCYLNLSVSTNIK